MNTVGIIAEYNPFHNGHKYQIDTVREKTDADYVIAIMSPDFVQRGEPALTDRRTRTRMALEGGADLVLSLPVAAACSSAEFFAEGALRILSRIGVTDYLAFGCEAPAPKQLEKLVTILNTEPEGYRILLDRYLRSGLPFPAAREQAALVWMKESVPLAAFS